MGIFSKLKRQKPVDDSKEEAKRAAAEEKKVEEKKTEEKKPEPEKKGEAKSARRGPKGKDKKPAKGALAKDGGGQSAKVLMEPVTTEKASNLESLGKYMFMVDPQTNKVEVANAVRDLYGVKPVSVRIVNLKGKKVRFGRVEGQRKDRKKAIVTLKSGDAISLYE